MSLPTNLKPDICVRCLRDKDGITTPICKCETAMPKDTQTLREEFLKEYSGNKGYHPALNEKIADWWLSKFSHSDRLEEAIREIEAMKLPESKAGEYEYLNPQIRNMPEPIEKNIERNKVLDEVLLALKNKENGTSN